MKVLYISIGMHKKNDNAIRNYKNIELHIHENIDILHQLDLHYFDCVYSPAIPINVNQFQNTKFLFGPHFSVFPVNHQMEIIRSPNVVYIQPSDWASKVWETNNLCNGIKVVSLPFGVDTQRFNEETSILNRNKVFIYYKGRHPNELNYIIHFLNSKGVEYNVFSYQNGYDENFYLNYLHNSKFGIWIGRHESQGFALEEALSCNVPLLVWSVTSMNQEYGYSYDDIPATTVPYWDNRCGEIFDNINELEITYQKFIDNIHNYKPREFILENLSIDLCEEKFIQIIKNM